MKRRAPAAERNREPILAVLRRVLPAQGLVLEIASGTGQHAEHFARHLPRVQWQPTDTDADALASIAAWRREAALPNLRPPLELDVTRQPWPVEVADAIFCANMLHIAPWRACEGLLEGAGRVLPPGGRLVLYGPFRIGGRHTAESNAAFDETLRARNPEWGVRDLDAVATLAAAQGLAHVEAVPMPANNFTMIFQKRE